MLAKQWLNNTREIMTRIEETQMENIKKAAEIMADSIGAERWVDMPHCLLKKCIHVLAALWASIPL